MSNENITNKLDHLPYEHIDSVISRAEKEIDKERQDEQLGLYCQWDGINRAMGKYFRFNHITQIAGLSSHGKSYLINQLIEDFTETKDIKNPDGSIFKLAINRNFKFNHVHIHFGFEMDATDEILRMLTRKINKSYHFLLSSEWQPDIQEFNKLTDKEYDVAVNMLNYFKNRPVYYVEISGNVKKMYNTIGKIVTKRAEELGCLPTEIKVSISLDHSLIVKRDEGATDKDLIQVVSEFALMVRKVFKAMVIILGQCNNNLKSLERISQPEFHYPLDSDIYMGAQINWVCDNIWIIYQPSLVNIKMYGVKKVNTKNLVVLSCVKTRKGVIGDVYLENRLDIGRYVNKVE